MSRQAVYKQRANDQDFASARAEALERQADLFEDALRTAAIDQHNIGGIIFGLKNLRPAKWRDRHDVTVDERNVSVSIAAELPPEALRDLSRLLALEADRSAPRQLASLVSAERPEE